MTDAPLTTQSYEQCTLFAQCKALCLNAIMDRAAKLRKLDAFRRKLPHVSQSALSAVLRAVASEGIPELTDRKTLRRARDYYLEFQTPYGPIRQLVTLQCVDGATRALEVNHPLANLWLAVQYDGGFTRYFYGCLQQNPCSAEHPWRLLLYSDEIVPGNPIGYHNHRKVWVIYYSLAELGLHALCREDAWFMISAARTDHVKELSAGLSRAETYSPSTHPYPLTS